MAPPTGRRGGELGNEGFDRNRTGPGGDRSVCLVVAMRRRRRSDGDGESEEKREELARARRERARMARAELAAKATAERDEDAEDMGERKPVQDREEKRAKTRRRLSEAARAKADEKPREEKNPKKETKKEREREGDRERSTVAGTGKKAADDESGKKRSAESKPSGAGRERGDRRKPVAGKKGKRGDRGAGVKRAGKGALVALKQGAVETGKRGKAAAPRVAAGAAGLLGGAFAIFFAGLAYALHGLIWVLHRVVPPVLAGLRLARRGLEALSRFATPTRVLALVVAGAAILLALSQFADYRSISIGNDAYADGIQTVAPAPVAETAETGSAHSYLMVPLAAVALIVLGAALTGRWRLCRLIALVGLAAIAIGLIHDRPTGLDTGDEALAYTGVEATLLGGFYAQLFSGLLLTLSSLLLGRELRLAGARQPARASRGSRVRRKLLRRNPRVEGARA